MGATGSYYIHADSAVINDGYWSHGGRRRWVLSRHYAGAKRLAAQLGRDVSPAVVYVSVEMAGLGHLRRHGRGELVLGPSAQNATLTELFTTAAISTIISDNVTGAQC